MLLLTGATVRAVEAVDPQIRCHSRISADGVVTPEPELDVAVPAAWDVTRRALAAPTTGLALLATRAAGMQQCAGTPQLVTFWTPPRAADGGTTVGEAYVVWMPSRGLGSGHPQPVDESGLPGERSSVRFGPNISQERAQETDLALHESHHVDQWAIASALAGPLGFPVMYIADSLLFPFSRNHFERAAGLSRGGYEEPSGFGPAPLWFPTGMVIAILALLMRARLRWLARVLTGGVSAGQSHAQDRCPTHSPGWPPAISTPKLQDMTPVTCDCVTTPVVLCQR
jgi:hypothetical protein